MESKITEKNIGQSKQTKQKWTEPNIFNTCFCIIFGCYGQSFISEGKTQALGKFEIFLIFPTFLKYQVLSNSTDATQNTKQSILY